TWLTLLISGHAGRIPPRFDRDVGHPRCGEPSHAVGIATGPTLADVAVDDAEAVTFGPPFLTVGRDLLMGAADEVPPHDDLFGERFAAEEDESSGFVAAVGDAQLFNTGSRVADRRNGHVDVLQGDIAGVDEEAVLESRIHGQVDARTGVEADLGAEQRRMSLHRRLRSPEVSEEDEHLSAG